VRKLESLGARIVDLKVPETQRISGTAFLLIVLSEALAAHERYLRRRPHDYQTQTQALLALGAQGHAQNYLRAQRVRSINIVEWLKRFDKVDAVLTPTTPRPAPTKEEAQATGVFELINYTASFDFNGCPSISVPAGLTDEGLPVGMMLSGPPFGEARLLRIAYAYQEATGFNRRRAPLEP
jgi:aspartyl-tRNA(Asn)/glutamyl-tRNA(Gln) amidotransferase subunit A